MLMIMIGAEVDPARRRGRNENREGEETSGLAGDGGPLGSFWWRGRDAGDGQQAGRLTQNRKEDTEKEGAAVTERKRPLLPPAGDGLSMQMTKNEGIVTGSGRLKLGYRKLWQKHTDKGRKEEREKKK